MPNFQSPECDSQETERFGSGCDSQMTGNVGYLRKSVTPDDVSPTRPASFTLFTALTPRTTGSPIPPSSPAPPSDI